VTQVEAVLVWLSVGLFTLGFCLQLVSLIFRKRWTTLGVAAAIGGLAALTGTIAVRWLSTGHAPVMRDYENALVAAWISVGFFILIWARWRNLALIGLVVLPLVMLTLGYGIMSTPKLEPLTPPFRSGWLWVHVIFAWLAYSAYTIAASIGALYLWKERQAGSNPAPEQLPSLEVLDEQGFHFVIFGFITQAVMIVAGSIWASSLWGSYWSWDPIESWSLASWLAYGVYLHLRTTYGWRGKRMAWIAVGALVLVIISFFGMTIVRSSFHIFNLM